MHCYELNVTYSFKIVCLVLITIFNMYLKMNHFDEILYDCFLDLHKEMKLKFSSLNQGLNSSRRGRHHEAQLGLLWTCVL